MNPLQGLIDSAKKAGHSVFSIKIGGKSYVYRSINRKEFRSIQDVLAKKAEGIRKEATEKSKGTKDDVVEESLSAEVDAKIARLKEEGEELTVQLALILEQPLTPDQIDNFPAGVITTLSDRILMAAGFGETAEDAEPVEL